MDVYLYWWQHEWYYQHVIWIHALSLSIDCSFDLIDSLSQGIDMVCQFVSQSQLLFTYSFQDGLCNLCDCVGQQAYVFLG